MERVEAGFKISLKSWHCAFKCTAPKNNHHQKTIIILSFLDFIPHSSPRGCSFQTHPDISEEFRPEQFHPGLCTHGKYSPLQPQYSMPRHLGQFHMAHDNRLPFTPQHHPDIITVQEHWNPRNTRLSWSYMTPEAPTSLAAAGGDWQTLSDTSATGNTTQGISQAGEGNFSPHHWFPLRNHTPWQT